MRPRHHPDAPRASAATRTLLCAMAITACDGSQAPSQGSGGEATVASSASSSTAATTGSTGGAGGAAPEFPPGQGQPSAKLPYPPGPYGATVGSTVDNLAFVGFANPKVDMTTAIVIELAAFYNPHADDASYQPATPEEDDRLFPP